MKEASAEADRGKAAGEHGHEAHPYAVACEEAVGFVTLSEEAAGLVMASEEAADLGAGRVEAVHRDRPAATVWEDGMTSLPEQHWKHGMRGRCQCVVCGTLKYP